MENREKLIEAMLSAKGREEVEAADRAAGEWLERYPEDPGVVAARQRMAYKNSGVAPPEGPLNRLTLYAFVVSLVIVGSVVLVLTGDVASSMVTGLATGLATATWVWCVGYFRWLNVPWHWFDRGP